MSTLAHIRVKLTVQYGMDMQASADALGVTVVELTNVLVGRSPMTTGLALALERATGMSAEEALVGCTLDRLEAARKQQTQGAA